MDRNALNQAEEELNEGHGSGSSQGRGVPENEEEANEEEQFDISLAASHSYMGSGLVEVSGRSVLEAGWEGQVPVTAHHGTVFPGETVPMLLTNSHDAAIITRAIQQDKLFGLLCPDESGSMVSGYGVLCEVYAAGDVDSPMLISFKARATHRFRCLNLTKQPLPIHAFNRMKFLNIRVLPEVRLGDPLRHSRLASLDALRRTGTELDSRLRSMDAAVTPWPLFVYNMFDYRRLRQLIKDYFKSMSMENVPTEAVSLSFWTASNLALSPRDSLALFVVDDALLRLHMEARLIMRKSLLCCLSCGVEIARREHIFAMSSEGVHSNYTNLGGYMHDIVTVSTANNTMMNGAPSEEFSWFPGYAWTIALCATCKCHIGWRFDAQKRNLRPQRFYGLCRNYVQPRSEDERTPHERSLTPPLPPPDLALDRRSALSEELRAARLALAAYVYAPERPIDDDADEPSM